MLREGLNEVEGVRVTVVRRRCRRLGLRLEGDGSVRLTVPLWRATLRQGEEFLLRQWSWVQKGRARILSRPAASRAPASAADLAALGALLAELNETWAARTGEAGVVWKIRQVKTFWGCCRWRTRTITYNAELAHAPRELVDYVVAHEYAHFAVHGHGPDFYRLMDGRLPGWRELRRRLNRRAW